MKDSNIERAMEMLCAKSRELGRLPQKGDFEPDEVGFIKQMLGPWPRALENTGMKEVSKSYIDKKVRAQIRRRKKRERYKKYAKTKKAEERKDRDVPVL